MAEPRFRPRIDDRHDKLAFVLAFTLGAVGILALRFFGADKSLSPPDFLAVTISVGIIIVYTTYILISTNRSSISLDRAGDNAYYLGLLFTLVSLGYSLWKIAIITTGDGVGTVRSADRVLSLLPDFGLALSSTIAGILARVFVQQFRNDPADIETQSRQELGEAIRMLRASLLQAVSDMNSTSRAANVAMTEVMTRTSKTIAENADASMAQISRLGEKVEERVNDFSDQVKPVSESLKMLAEEIGTTVSHIKEQTAGLNFDGAPVQQGLQALTTELESMRQQISSTKESCRSFSDELSGLVGRFSNVMSEDLVEQLQRTGSNVLERQGQFVSILGAIENDIKQLRVKLSDISDKVSGATQNLEGQLMTQLEMINNDATQIKQKLGDIGDKVPNVTEDLERMGADNQAVASQLQATGAQLTANQQNLLSELNSLQEKARKLGKALDQTPKAKRLKRRFWWPFS